MTRFHPRAASTIFDSTANVRRGKGSQEWVGFSQLRGGGFLSWGLSSEMNYVGRTHHNHRRLVVGGGLHRLFFFILLKCTAGTPHCSSQSRFAPV